MDVNSRHDSGIFNTSSVFSLVHSNGSKMMEPEIIKRLEWKDLRHKASQIRCVRTNPASYAQGGILDEIERVKGSNQD